MNKIINGLKKAVYNLPTNYTQALKRSHYRWQINSKKFKSDEPEYNLLKKWIKTGDSVIDVGANVGHYSLELSKLVGPTGRVFAFEPHPENFELLSSNVLFSPYRNLSLFNIALGSSISNVCMETPIVEGMKNLYRCNISKYGKLSVFCMPLDCICKEIDISFIKIDAEGYEYEVLKGMRTIIKKFNPVLIIEGYSPKVEKLMKMYGFSFEKISDSPNRIFFKKSHIQQKL